MPCWRYLRSLTSAIGLREIWEVLGKLREAFPPCIMLNGRCRGQQAYGYGRSYQDWNANWKNIFHIASSNFMSFINKTVCTDWTQDSNVRSSQRTRPARRIMIAIQFYGFGCSLTLISENNTEVYKYMKSQLYITISLHIITIWLLFCIWCSL